MRARYVKWKFISRDTDSLGCLGLRVIWSRGGMVAMISQTVPLDHFLVPGIHALNFSRLHVFASPGLLCIFINSSANNCIMYRSYQAGDIDLPPLMLIFSFPWHQSHPCQGCSSVQNQNYCVMRLKLLLLASGIPFPCLNHLFTALSKKNHH